MQQQDKSYQVSSNGFHTPILEIRREDQWSSRNARSSDRHNQLWSIRMDSTRFILKMKLITQFTTQKGEKLVAEKLNGRLAMLGIIAGIGAYLTTGQLIPGFV